MFFNVNDRATNNTQSSTDVSIYAGDTRGIAVNMGNFSGLTVDSSVITRYQNTNGITLNAEL